MQCEKCHQRPATVHYTEIVNGRKREMHLCAVCAGEEGIGNIKISTPFSGDSLFAGILGAQVPRHYEGAVEDKGCPQCGMTRQEFAHTGRFGCADCYRTFRQGLEPMLRRVQGGLRHTGKVPARSQGRVRQAREIERLRVQLQEAVRREDFEKAAALRDQIRAKEQQQGKGA